MRFLEAMEKAESMLECGVFISRPEWKNIEDGSPSRYIIPTPKRVGFDLFNDFTSENRLPKFISDVVGKTVNIGFKKPYIEIFYNEIIEYTGYDTLNSPGWDVYITKDDIDERQKVIERIEKNLEYLAKLSEVSEIVEIGNIPIKLNKHGYWESGNGIFKKQKDSEKS